MPGSRQRDNGDLKISTDATTWREWRVSIAAVARSSLPNRTSSPYAYDRIETPRTLDDLVDDPPRCLMQWSGRDAQTNGRVSQHSIEECMFVRLRQIDQIKTEFNSTLECLRYDALKRHS